jgi:CheY-like chemotaxis protein
MPGMSGTELYFRVLEKAPASKDKIIIVTGDLMGLDIKAFLAQNKLPFLSKPFDIIRLKKQISDIINIR